MNIVRIESNPHSIRFEHRMHTMPCKLHERDQTNVDLSPFFSTISLEVESQRHQLIYLCMEEARRLRASALWALASATRLART